MLEQTIKGTVVVIGAGAAGVGTALKLADAGYKVTVIERNSEALAGSSDATPCRLGLGFHYMDLETAQRYLEATIKFMREYGEKIPDLTIGMNESDSGVATRLRRGRYFITEDSTYAFADIVNLHEELKKHYEKLILQDPANKVFGAPEEFSQPLRISKYSRAINGDRVNAAYETAELILNWPRFKTYLQDELKRHPNISFLPSHEVIDLSYGNPRVGNFCVSAKDRETGIEKGINADLIVNASWYNIAYLSSKLGIFPRSKRTSRIKAMIKIDLSKLSPEFVAQLHSMFFCFGAHCSLNLVDRNTAYLTYEPITNLYQTSKSRIPGTWEKLLWGEIDEKLAIEIIHKLNQQLLLELTAEIYASQEEGATDTLSEQATKLIARSAKNLKFLRTLQGDRREHSVVEEEYVNTFLANFTLEAKRRHQKSVPFSDDEYNVLKVLLRNEAFRNNLTGTGEGFDLATLEQVLISTYYASEPEERLPHEEFVLIVARLREKIDWAYPLDPELKEVLTSSLRSGLAGPSVEITSDELTDRIKAMIGEAILAGAGKYIPGVEGADIVDYRFGVVQTDGAGVNIYDPKSAHNSRKESGVESTEVTGFVLNRANKLLYFLGNAEETLELIAEKVGDLKTIKAILAGICLDMFPEEASQKVIWEALWQVLMRSNIEGLTTQEQIRKNAEEVLEKSNFKGAASLLSQIEQALFSAKLEELKTQMQKVIEAKKRVVDAIKSYHAELASGGDTCEAAIPSITQSESAPEQYMRPAPCSVRRGTLFFLSESASAREVADPPPLKLPGSQESDLVLNLSSRRLVRTR